MKNRWRGSTYIEDPKNAKERYQSKSNRKKPIAKRKMHSQTKQAIKGSKNQLNTRTRGKMDHQNRGKEKGALEQPICGATERPICGAAEVAVG